MINELRHQQMRQHGGCRAPARCRHRRCWRLGNRIARGAGIFRPDVLDHLEVARHVIQNLGHVLTEFVHALAAVGALAGAIIGRLMHDLLARQMIGQRQALWLAGLADRNHRFGGISISIGFRGPFGLTGFQLLEPQFQLLDLARDPLRRTAKLHAAQLGDLKLQLLDLQRLVLHREFRHLQLALAGQGEGVQFSWIGGQFGGGERHGETIFSHTLVNHIQIRIGALSDKHWSTRSRRHYCAAPVHCLDQHR